MPLIYTMTFIIRCFPHFPSSIINYKSAVWSLVPGLSTPYKTLPGSILGKFHVLPTRNLLDQNNHISIALKAAIVVVFWKFRWIIKTSVVFFPSSNTSKLHHNIGYLNIITLYFNKIFFFSYWCLRRIISQIIILNQSYKVNLN